MVPGSVRQLHGLTCGTGTHGPPRTKSRVSPTPATIVTRASDWLYVPPGAGRAPAMTT